MVEQAVKAVDNRRPSGGDVCVRLALHLLPPVRPEPGLLGRNRHHRNEFDATVLLFDELYLGVRAVEVKPPPQVRRKRNLPRD